MNDYYTNKCKSRLKACFVSSKDMSRAMKAMLNDMFILERCIDIIIRIAIFQNILT